MSRPLPYAHPPEDYIPTLQKLLSNPPVTPEPILKSHNLTAEFTKVTMLIDPINGFPPGYDWDTWRSYFDPNKTVTEGTSVMDPCCCWYGSVAHPWDDLYGKYKNGGPPPFPSGWENDFTTPIPSHKLTCNPLHSASQTPFNMWAKSIFNRQGGKWETNYDEKYFVLFVVWRQKPQASIMLLHERITALEKNYSKELLEQLETTDELTKFLVQAKVQTHEEGLRREGFCEVDDLVDAEDKDLVDAGLKITEIRRIRRYLSKPKLSPNLTPLVTFLVTFLLLLPLPLPLKTQVYLPKSRR